MEVLFTIALVIIALVLGVILCVTSLVLELREGRFINNEEIDKRLDVLIEERKSKY